MGVMSSFEKFFVNRASERNARETIEIIGAHLSLSSEATVLELGAGEGALSYFVRENYRPKRLVVTDYDPSQLVLAESYFERKLGSIPKDVEFKTVDALRLPFTAETFDALFAMHVLHHVERHEWHFKNIPRALDEVRRVLKVGGVFVYEEIFNKGRIRDYLLREGFDMVFEKRNWPGNLMCVFTKTRQEITASRETESPFIKDQ
jgi:ubiquinone/menaquinone biosynthesis C-methylase UbiE